MAETLGVTERSLRNWKREDPAEPVARPGRPRVPEEQLDEVRAAVCEELDRQGWDVGEGTIHRALGGRFPLSRIRRVLAELKRERRRRLRAHREEARTSIVVHARDALWSMDATHVGRTPAGAKVESEAVREVRSTRTIGLSVGPPATSEEVVVVLECAKRERGTAPLVLISDNGSPYRGQHVAHWCAENGVLQLFTIPRTPQHNPASEHGMGELKRGTPLGKGTLVLDNAAADALLVRRRNQLDGRRLRPTRGWSTARDFDRASPSWDTLVRREVFYREGTCAIQRAVLDSNTGRERRRAEREAILATLERFSVITRTRGGRPWSAQ